MPPHINRGFNRFAAVARHRLFKVGLFLICSTDFFGQQEQANKCDSLQSLHLRDTVITAAAVIPQAPFALPTSATSDTPSLDLPSYCKVTASIRPSPDSDIAIELWLPTSQWNGKLLGTGNVNWCGGVNHLQMALGLREHYATVGTDRGHKSCAVDDSFVLNPEKLVDFGYRSVHEMTIAGKQIVANYYGIAPKRSYFTGGSSGGGEALMEAQRYPEDYGGIVAGAPTNYWTRLMAASVWNAQIARALSRAKLSVLHEAVVQACDSYDGIGLLDDPRQCNLDPESLLCSDGQDSQHCLTRTEVDAAKQIYAGPRNPRTGEAIYPGLERGSELGWPVGGPNRNHADYFRNVVHRDPNWDWRTFDLERDVAFGDETGQASLNAIDPDLRRFVARRGKLILLHGWSDSALAPRNTINYYESVAGKIGPRIQDSIRLFMVPRIGHGGGGRGTDQFNALAALERWVEANIAPDYITAQHITGVVGAGPGTGVTMERPLCPYPKIARWKGTGSTNDAANFQCASVRVERRQGARELNH